MPKPRDADGLRQLTPDEVEAELLYWSKNSDLAKIVGLAFRDPTEENFNAAVRAVWPATKEPDQQG